MWRWEAHRRALRLVLARSGPMWPEQVGRRRRAAPRGAESLKPVDYYSADSEFQNQHDTGAWIITVVELQRVEGSLSCWFWNSESAL